MFKHIKEFLFPTYEKKEEVKDVFTEGNRSFKDILAPNYINRENPSILKINDSYVKGFSIDIYPSVTNMGYLDDLFNYEGNLDVAMHIYPFDRATALKELQNQITAKKSQYQIDAEKGNETHLSEYEYDIAVLERQRDNIQQQRENFFYLEVFGTLIEKSEKEIKKKMQILENSLKGQNIALYPMHLKQDEAFCSTLPIGESYFHDTKRNVNTAVLADSNPFYSSSFSNDKGILMGINAGERLTSPIVLDPFDRMYSNANMVVVGKSGAGKTYFLFLLLMRHIINGGMACGLDPEGEFSRFASAINGVNIDFSPTSSTRINIMELTEVEMLDQFGNPTGKYYVPIDEKILNVINFLAVMCKDLTTAQVSELSMLIKEIYTEKGFSEDPDTLYEEVEQFDEKNKSLTMGKEKRKMPILSDLKVKIDNSLDKYPDLKDVSNTLLMYVQGGSYAIFDAQTNVDLDIVHIPYINFDVHKVEEDIIRPLAMFTIFQWLWDNVITKHPEIQKFLIIDEMWQLVNGNLAGRRYTARALEKCARRIRKRNAGLISATQQLRELKDSPEGMSVLTNSEFKFIFKTDEADLGIIAENFQLTDGELNFLRTCRKHYFLAKTSIGSCTAYAHSFAFEHQWIEKYKKAS